MANIKHRLTVYSGSNKFKLGGDDTSHCFVIPDDKYGTPLDDEYANEYVLSTSLSLTRSGDNLVATFTPCTDEELLTRVSKGKTRVRIQLLHYTVSGHTMHGKALGPGTYWINESNKYRNAYSYWTRCGSNVSSCEELTWVDLSAAQLRAGTYTFVDACDFLFNSLNTECNMWPVEEDGGPTPRISAEMFCPALYRSGMDIYYYEYADGAYCISDNCITYE